MPLLPTAGVEGARTIGAETAGAVVVLRRLAALAMRRATEERVGLAEAEAGLRLLDLAAGLAVAVVAAERLRPVAALRLDGAAFTLAAGLAFAGLALAADRVERAFAGATG